MRSSGSPLVLSVIAGGASPCSPASSTRSSLARNRRRDFLADDSDRGHSSTSGALNHELHPAPVGKPNADLAETCAVWTPALATFRQHALNQTSTIESVVGHDHIAIEDSHRSRVNTHDLLVNDTTNNLDQVVVIVTVKSHYETLTGSLIFCGSLLQKLFGSACDWGLVTSRDDSSLSS